MLTIFLLGIVVIVCLASVAQPLLPLDAKGQPLTMVPVIQFVMLAAGALILFFTGVKPKAISDSKVFNAGMIAVVMIMGIAWMSDTVISGKRATSLTCSRPRWNAIRGPSRYQLCYTIIFIKLFCYKAKYNYLDGLVLLTKK